MILNLRKISSHQCARLLSYFSVNLEKFAFNNSVKGAKGGVSESLEGLLIKLYRMSVVEVVYAGDTLHSICCESKTSLQIQSSYLLSNLYLY